MEKTMTSRNQSHQHILDELGWLWPLLLVLGSSVALPALLLGAIIQRVVGMRSWSFPFWFMLAGVGAVLAYVFYMHGFERLLGAQFTAYVREIKRYQADISQWNIGLLWSNTWPVWLRTPVLTPPVAFWQEIEAQMRGGRAASLEKQERQRQQHIARAKKQTTRRVRHPERLPDALDG